LLHTPHFTRTIAAGTFDRFTARLCPRPVTGGTNGWTAYVNLPFYPKNSFLKRDRQVITQIGTAPWPLATATTCPTPKKLLKYISKRKSTALETTGKTTILHGIMPKTVIAGASFIIRQHFIGFVNLFEFLTGRRVFIDIGVVLPRQPSVRLFEFVLSGAP
jgi:hypothetical protein